MSKEDLAHFTYKYGKIYFREVKNITNSYSKPNDEVVMVIVTTKNKYITLHEEDGRRFLKEYEEWFINA